MNLRVCLPQLLAGVHQEFVGEHVRQNASVCGMSACLWLVSSPFRWFLTTLLLISLMISILCWHPKANTITTQVLHNRSFCKCLQPVIGKHLSIYIITVWRIPDNYGVIWCAQVRFSIIRAKSAKAFDSCPASRQLYKALL